MKKRTILLTLVAIFTLSLFVNAENNMGKMKKCGENGRKSYMMKRAQGFLNKLKTQEPAEYQRLVKLRNSDSKAFKKALKEKVKEIMKAKKAKFKEIQEKCRNLAKAYNEATDDSAKATIKTELEALITKTFTERLQEQVNRNREMEARLKEFKERIEKQEAEKASIIQKRVERILSGKKGRGNRKKDGYKKGKGHGKKAGDRRDKGENME